MAQCADENALAEVLGAMQMCYPVSAQFNIPSTIICGAGAMAELGPQLTRLGVRRVLIVTDEFIGRSGIVSRVEADLRKRGLEPTVFADVQPDPTEENVLSGLAQFRSAGAEVLVAIGGGSPIDCAKAIALLTTNPPLMSLSRPGTPEGVRSPRFGVRREPSVMRQEVRGKISMAHPSRVQRRT